MRERIPRARHVRIRRRCAGLVAHVVPHQRLGDAELHVGVQIRIVAAVDLRELALEPGLDDQEVQVRGTQVVPALRAQDVEQGFLLLSDLGSTTYLQVLDAENAPALYFDATTALISMQKASRPDVLPEYDRDRLLAEMELFPVWYVGRHLKAELSEAETTALYEVFDRILDVNLAEPQVFVHRDYHSRNLMVTAPNPGVIDFQDAVYGPISYDLVSLFKDAYIDWDEEQVLDWLIRYWQDAKRAGLPVREDFAEFHREYEFMGVQRHLKVLGIFARLYHRDGKDGYLKDMPRVMNYLRATAMRYRDLAPLARLLNRLEGITPQAGYTF